MAARVKPVAKTKAATPLTKLKAWKALGAHYKKVQKVSLKKLFADDPNRGLRLTVDAVGIFLDYSKNRVTDETLKLLLQLAEESGLRGRIDAMFRGEKINITENRAVLHVALRAPRGGPSWLMAKMSFRKFMRCSTQWPASPTVSAAVNGKATPASGSQHHQYRHRRLRSRPGHGLRGAATLQRPRPDFPFISNVDGTDFAEAVHDLDPAETLFIISSKTFTTLETMTNAESARDWALAGLGGDEKAVASHFVAVSTNAGSLAFGIDTANMFGFWDWVGGRYSMDSAIGLSTMIAVGPENFPRHVARLSRDGRAFPHRAVREKSSCPDGASRRLVHRFFRRADAAVLPYDQYLKRFPAYLQQLTMESNGKHVTLDGARSTMRPARSTGANLAPTASIPSTSSSIRERDSSRATSLLSPSRSIRSAVITTSCWPMSLPRPKRWPSARPPSRSGPKALRIGSCRTASLKATVRPIRSWLEKLTPATLGKLVALYEHSVFTQGTIWRIDSFDQWGVELGKVLAQRIIPELESPTEPKLKHDSSTNNLIRRYRKARK